MASRTMRLLREDSKDEWAWHPRPYHMTHPPDFYVSGECLKRPLYAVHALFRTAEGILWRSVHGRGIPPGVAVLAARFFGTAQSLVDFVLAAHLWTKRPEEMRERLRARMAPALEEFGELMRALRPKVNSNGN